MSLLLLFGGSGGGSEPENQPFDILVSNEAFSGYMFFVPNIAIPAFSVKQSFFLAFEQARDFSVEVSSRSSVSFRFESEIDFEIGAQVRSDFFLEMSTDDISFSINNALGGSNFYMSFFSINQGQGQEIGLTEILRYISGDV